MYCNIKELSSKRKWGTTELPITIENLRSIVAIKLKDVILNAGNLFEQIKVFKNY